MPAGKGRDARYSVAEQDLVPTSTACALFASLRAYPVHGRWLALYPQGYHYLTRNLQRECTIRDIRAWLAAPGTAPPSGAGLPPAAAINRLCHTAAAEA